MRARYPYILSKRTGLWGFFLFVRGKTSSIHTQYSFVTDRTIWLAFLFQILHLKTDLLYNYSLTETYAREVCYLYQGGQDFIIRQWDNKNKLRNEEELKEYKKLHNLMLHRVLGGFVPSRLSYTCRCIKWCKKACHEHHVCHVPFFLCLHT